mgnify:CR=1 FL=1
MWGGSRSPFRPVRMLAYNDSYLAQPIHLGLRSGGVSDLVSYLKALEEIGIDHVVLNLRLYETDMMTTLNHLVASVLLEFTF